jgi:hypothetical protein
MKFAVYVGTIYPSPICFLLRTHSILRNNRLSFILPQYVEEINIIWKKDTYAMIYIIHSSVQEKTHNQVKENHLNRLNKYTLNLWGSIYTYMYTCARVQPPGN